MGESRPYYRRDGPDGDRGLAEPVGDLAGHYGDASRNSFALHILDELIHHGAGVALLRDLYRASHD